MKKKSDNKKILIILPRPAIPVNSGYSSRIYNLLKGLKQRGFQTTIISLSNKIFTNSEIQKYGEICEKVIPVYYNKIFSYLRCIRGLWSKNSIKSEYFNIRKVHQVVDKEIRDNDFDLLCGYYYQSEQFLSKHTGKKWIDLSDSIAMQHERRLKRIKNIFKKIFLIFESKKVLEIEKRCLKNIDIITMISKFDKDYLIKYPSKNNIEIIRLGVEKREQNNFKYNKNELCFLGDMSYVHNYDACKYLIRVILPKLLKKNPNFIFKIIGKADNIKLHELCRDNKNVKIMGFVEDLEKELCTSLAMTCPILTASGIQTKILDAMSYGLPVITTKLAAAPITDSNDIILTPETEDDWVSAIEQLANDSSYRNKISVNSREFVREYFSWENEINNLCMLLDGNYKNQKG